MYNGFGIAFSQCISHIQRDLKGIYDFINHTGPKKMAEFLTRNNNYRNELIAKGIERFDEQEYQKIIDEYDEIVRSCINTYKKQGINVYRALIKAFQDEVIIA